MLGWEVLVCRQPDDTLLAHWKTGVFGLRWLDALASAGRAVRFGGDGYPNRYSIAAGVLLPILRHGLPRGDSSLTIGDDYVLPPGWNSTVKWRGKAADCRPEELLSIEAWDQS